jgi:hypothetical protein
MDNAERLHSFDSEEWDAIDEAIENDCILHCTLCGTAFDLSGNGEGMVFESRELPDQVKICIRCAIQVAAATQRLMHEADICEHGVVCGEWCEPCHDAYRDSQIDPENGNGG